MGMTALEGLVMGTRSGDLDPGAMVLTFDGLVDGREHLAIGMGPDPECLPLVRLHSEWLTGEVTVKRTQAPP